MPGHVRSLNRRFALAMLPAMLAVAACDDWFGDDDGPVRIVWSIAIEDLEALGGQQAMPALWDEGIAFPMTEGIVARSRANGTVLWRVPFDGGVPRALMYRDGVLYGAGHEAYAIDAADGSILWQTPLPGDGELNPAAIDESRLFATVRGGGVATFDLATGAPVWHTWLLEPPATAAVVHAVGAADGRLYVALEHDYGDAVRRGYIVALDPATGDELWRYTGRPRPGTNLSSFLDVPATAEGLLFAADGWANSFVALDAATGDSVWAYAGLPGWLGPFTAPVVADGVVYGGSPDLHVRAFDSDDGDLRWATELWSSVNEVVLCGEWLLASRYDLDVLNPRTGAVVDESFIDETDFIVSRIVTDGNDAFVVANYHILALRCS